MHTKFYRYKYWPCTFYWFIIIIMYCLAFCFFCFGCFLVNSIVNKQLNVFLSWIQIFVKVCLCLSWFLDTLVDEQQQ